MIKLFGEDPQDDLVMKYKALTIYGYHDGPTLFTARGQRGDRNSVYLFRWTPYDQLREMAGSRDEEKRTYKADGFDVTTKEDEVDWSEVEA